MEEFTHRQALRNLMFVWFLFTILFCAVLSLIISEQPASSYLLEGMFVGILTGMMAGILFNKLFFWIWDPVTLGDKSQKLLPSCAIGCIIPVLVIFVIVGGFLIITLLGYSFSGWFQAGLIAWIFTVIGYLTYQVWRHQPE